MGAALLSRSIDRAERVHIAMLSRGFSGVMPHRQLSWKFSDTAFIIFAGTVFAFLRFFPLGKWIGEMFLKVITK